MVQRCASGAFSQVTSTLFLISCRCIALNARDSLPKAVTAHRRLSNAIKPARIYNSWQIDLISSTKLVLE